jgi:beta-galactosidase
MPVTHCEDDLMTATPFNDHWTVRAPGGAEKPITLPHDAMIHESRSADHPTGSHGAYFLGGRYLYTKHWKAPADAARRRLTLIFEGVYGDTVVRLNGQRIGACASGYREFAVRLDPAIRPDADNLLEVDVDNSHVPNSRWYSGSGIYRPVWLENTPLTAFTRDGLRFRTRSIDSAVHADVDVDIEVVNPENRQLSVAVTLADETRIVAEAQGVITATSAGLALTVPDAVPWSHAKPHLYRATARLHDGDVVLDERELRIGLRTVQVDAVHGLRVNGERVLLRGACVHHDNGILGAATFRTAEFRRARILKENGFNAIRCAHNPLSRAFLDACDEMGLYVMDELTDVWYGSKTLHDTSARFDDLWRDDARAMVTKDRNHPSVIMYSIGNEIAETATPRGAEVARQINAFVKDLDPHRLTTVAVNFLLNVMASRGKNPFDRDEHADPGQSPMSSTMANIVANRIGFVLQTVARLPAADRVSRDAFAAVDVAGYNYGWGRYARDARLHPDRVVVGSESMTGDIVKIWHLVESLPNVIGDFIWTGWDYLGETGAGSWTLRPHRRRHDQGPPAHRRGSGRHRHHRHARRPCPVGTSGLGTTRRPADRRAAPERCRQEGAAGGVAQQRRGAELGVGGLRGTRRRAGGLLPRRGGRGAAQRPFIRSPEVRPEARLPDPLPHPLRTRRDRRGRLPRRHRDRTQQPDVRGHTRLRLRPEGDRLTGDGQDLMYVWIELADESGVVEMMAGDLVTVSVTGAGRLAALGSAAPRHGDVLRQRRPRHGVRSRAGRRPGRQRRGSGRHRRDQRSPRQCDSDIPGRPAAGTRVLVGGNDC